LNPDKVQKVSDCIEKFPTYGYRRIALLLSENRKVIQRILQKKHWQVRKRPVGHRPRVKVVPSQAPERDIRWSTDLARVWCGRNQWCHLALVIDCGSRELLGWRLSSRGHAKTAEAALEEALIHRFGHLGRTTKPIILRSDNGLVFTSKRYTNTVRSYGLTQEFITPYTPEQNGIVERFIKSLKEECVWQHRFESLSQAQSVIASWIRHYNTERPHQALGYKPPILFDKVQELSA
jgi:Transposase and inactivated derivatives